MNAHLKSDASTVVDVVVVADPEEPHCDAVLAELTSLGSSALRYNLSDFLATGLRLEPGALHLHLAGEWRTLTRETSVWWYRTGNVDTDGLDPEEACLAHDEGVHLIRGALGSASVRWIDEPFNVDRADTKPIQLNVAARLGNRVPDTLVTNDPVIAHTFAAGRRVVAKAVSPGVGITPYVDEVPDCALDMVQGLPTLLQEYVPATADLRVVVVTTRAWVWRRPRESGVIDWRQIDPGGEGFELVGDVALGERAIAMTGALGLTMSVQDWLEIPGGPVFLESNAQGAWLFLRGSDEIVVSALAEHLKG